MDLNSTLAPLPPGFTLDTPLAVPPPPAGFTLDVQPTQIQTPPPPPGFSLDVQPTQIQTPPPPAGFTLDMPGAATTATPDAAPDPVAAAPADATQPADPGFFGAIGNALVRGKNNYADQPVNVFGYLTGSLTPEEAAAGILNDLTDAQGAPMTAGAEAANKAMRTDGVWNTIKSDPLGVASLSSQVALEALTALPATVAAAAGGALAGGAVGGATSFGAGAPVGAVVGGGLGAGAVSGAQEFASGIVEALTNSGVPVTQENLTKLLSDPQFMAAAKERALKGGLAVGALDAITAGAAGRLFGPVRRVAEPMVGKIASGGLGALAETAVQAGGGAGGEALKQVWNDGRITSPADVALEALAEIPGSAVEVPSTYHAIKSGEGSRADVQGQKLGNAINDAVNSTDLSGYGSAPLQGPSAVAPPVGTTTTPVAPVAPNAQQPAAAEVQQPAAEVQQPAAEVQQPAAPTDPNVTSIFTPDNTELSVQTQVVEADSLLTSDQQGYPQELQPRDRNRAASLAQIERIANNPNPLRLDQAPESDRGSPIIGPDGGVVESGNGRVMGLRLAYQRGTAEAYRQYVVQRFPEAANMRNPVLVRRRVSDVNTTDFTAASNKPATLAMSATENAQSDARHIDSNVLGLYRGGDVFSAPNRDMVRAFISRLPASEHGALVNAQGGLNIEGQRRFEAAVFSRAYGDGNLLSRLTERTDDDMRSATNSLRAAAPAIAGVRNAIESGVVSPEADIAKPIVAAMQALADIRARDTNLRDFQAQQDAFAEPLPADAAAVLSAFYNDPGTRLASQNDMQDFLHALAAAAMEQKVDQATLPGVEPKPLKNSEQLANDALAAKRNAPPETGSLFEAQGVQPARGQADRGQPDLGRAEKRQPADGGRRAGTSEPLADAADVNSASADATVSPDVASSPADATQTTDANQTRAQKAALARVLPLYRGAVDTVAWLPSHFAQLGLSDAQISEVVAAYKRYLSETSPEAAAAIEANLREQADALSQALREQASGSVPSLDAARRIAASDRAFGSLEADMESQISLLGQLADALSFSAFEESLFGTLYEKGDVRALITNAEEVQGDQPLDYLFDDFVAWALREDAIRRSVRNFKAATPGVAANDTFADAGAAQTRAPKGGMTPTTNQVSFTSEGALDKQAYVDAGYTADSGQLLPPAKKKNVLAKLLEDRFGLKIDHAVEGKKIAALDAVDQMLDAYRSVRFMLHTLALPEKALGLGGTLTIALEKFTGRYLGAYDPETRTIHMPGRSNSFAHEWMHALDHFLRDKLAPQSFQHLLSQVARAEGVDPREGVQGAYVNLIYKMFFDQADLANKLLALEARAQAVYKKGPDKGKPTKDAINAQGMLESARKGMARIKIKPSDYRANSAQYGQGAPYWSSVHEMLARAFEAYIAYKVETANGPNAFITKGDAAYLSDADARLALTFPKASERMAIFSAFDNLFDHIRANAMLGTDAPTARPGDANIMGPNYYINAAEASGMTMTKGLKEEISAFAVWSKNMLTKPLATLRNSTAIWSQNLGVADGAGVKDVAKAGLRIFGDGARYLFASNRWRMKAIIRRQPKEAQMFLKEIMHHLSTDPGTNQAISETHLEEISITMKQTSARIEAAIRASGLVPNTVAGRMARDKTKVSSAKVGLSEADNVIVRELMFGNGHPDATPAHEKLAAELSRVMDDFWRKARNAGLQIGYVENKGYLTRSIVTSAVDANRPAFAQKAAEVYRLQYDRLTSDIAVDKLLELAAAVSHGSEGERYTPVVKGPFAAEYKALYAAWQAEASARTKLNAAKKAHQSAPTAQTAADLAAAQQAHNAAKADLTKTKDELTVALRDPYAEQAASNWQDRILRGQSNSFDSLGPAANFLKARTLPPEADAILADFYETDVLTNVLDYAMHTTARAGYVKRFGTTGGNNRFQHIDGRPDIRQTMSAKPIKYNKSTAAGRLAIIRDLTDNSKDNKLELLLEQAVKSGASADDVRTLRGIVENMTGRAGGGLDTDHISRLITWHIVWGSVQLLGKAPLSAVTEPLAIAMRTGSLAVAARTFLTYTTEAVRTLDTVQERAKFAKAIGLIASPLYDSTVASRMGMDVRDTVHHTTVLTRFHAATGLQAITNASRRASMVGGFFWMHDLAAQYNSAKTSAKKLEKIKRAFRELGIHDSQMPDMASWLEAQETLPDTTSLDTAEGRLFASAIVRFVDQTIMEPNQSDKPALASHPIGRMAYQLSSFLYAFAQNMHLATVERTKADYRIGRDLGESKARAATTAIASNAAPFLAGYALVYMGQFVMTCAREAIFNQDQWDKHEKEDDLLKWLAQVALSRTGVAGPVDIVLNAMTGLRYERDLTSLLLGPFVSNNMNHLQNIDKGLPTTTIGGYTLTGSRNTDGTNTAERKAAQSAYLMLVAPAINIGLSSLDSKGPLGWTTRWAAMQMINSYTAGGIAADVVAGPAEK